MAAMAAAISNGVMASSVKRRNKTGVGGDGLRKQQLRQLAAAAVSGGMAAALAKSAASAAHRWRQRWRQKWRRKQKHHGNGNNQWRQRQRKQWRHHRNISVSAA